MRCGKLRRREDAQKPTGPELRRGMTLLSSTKEELGTLAAVVENAAGEVSGFLLVRPQKQFEYLLVAVGLIEEITEEAVTVQLTTTDVDALPPYHRSP